MGGERKGKGICFYLEEAFEPPDLEDTLCDQDGELEDAPPFDAGIGTLGRVAVSTFAHDDVGLLVFDLREKIGELSN